MTTNKAAAITSRDELRDYVDPLYATLKDLDAVTDQVEQLASVEYGVTTWAELEARIPLAQWNKLIDSNKLTREQCKTAWIDGNGKLWYDEIAPAPLWQESGTAGTYVSADGSHTAELRPGGYYAELGCEMADHFAVRVQGSQDVVGTARSLTDAERYL